MRGLRPSRLSRPRTRKLPNPRSSTLSDLARDWMMLPKTMLTTRSVSFFVRLIFAAIRSTNSALVMGNGNLPGDGDGRGPA